MAKLNGVAIGSIAVGSILLYAGITGKNIPQAVQSLISGKGPVASKTAPITSTATTSAAPVTGQAAPQTGQTGIYSHAQLQVLWISNGGNPAAANNAACHAIQESSGNPRATSSNPDGGTNAGLWQLDTPGGKGAGYTVAQLQDPNTNARVAIMGSRNGTDWSAWATPGC